MKRTVILVRHGKACALDAFEKDIDRVLTERGVNDGYKVAKKILKAGIKPDIILTSPAARASHSALIFARAMKTGTEIVKVREDFYHGSGSKMLKEVAGLPDEIGTVALFAHNPGISDLAEHLTGGATSFLPTTGVAILNYDTEKWQDINTSEPEGYDFIIPRAIK
ncbi:MAG: histidine phosphatase family protein [Bacteroidales bacterium]|nr:histidine phosphatase family protein [Bacteroidales bacterium]